MRKHCLGIAAMAAGIAGLLGAGVASDARAAVVLTNSDTTTQGNWRGPAVVYGTQGYVLSAYDGSGASATDRVQLPSYISSYTVGGWQTGSWNFGMSSNPALQDPDDVSESNLGCWYNSSVTMTVTLVPSQSGTFQVALYAADANATLARTQTISVDGTTLATLSDFQSGVWEVFEIDATANTPIEFGVTRTAGDNAVISAIAFDSVPEPAAVSLAAAPVVGLIIRRRRH